MSSTPIQDMDNPGSLRAAWSGLEPLWLVFWVYGAIGGSVLSYGFEKISERLPSYAVLLLCLPLLAFYVWVNVAIWRCAANSSPLWCFLARGTVVLTVLYVPWAFWSGFSGGT
jgi:hypothetical protein